MKRTFLIGLVYWSACERWQSWSLQTQMLCSFTPNAFVLLFFVYFFVWWRCVFRGSTHKKVIIRQELHFCHHKPAENLTVSWDQACELLKLALNPKRKPSPSEQVKKTEHCFVVTDPHTDGRQTPASPVHHVEEEETRYWDEVLFWKWSETNKLLLATRLPI